MRIMINGKPEEAKAGTVLELLQSKEIEPQMVSVELNTEVLDREAYSTTPIKENDKIEFLFFMGGGCSQTIYYSPFTNNDFIYSSFGTLCHPLEKKP